jgi:hypothetical protein
LFSILFIPFPFHLFPFQETITRFLFGQLIDVTATSLFSVDLKSTIVYSDSASMYVLLLIVFVLSAIISLFIKYIPDWDQHRSKVFNFIHLLFCYYLVLMLLKYGVDKIFKSQFYLPEPNTLYTSLGYIDKDLLYWSTMGTSRLYNVFTGSIEVLASVLLFFKRTRMTGLLLAALSLLQVVVVNFSFDISVKLYSILLFSLSLYLLAPYRQRLVAFLFTRREIPALPPPITVFSKHPSLSVFIRCLIAGLFLFEVFYPYIQTYNFNDDTAGRPYLHGAYEVKEVIAGTDTLNEADYPVKRFFIHRNGYMIFQNNKDEMQDYSLIYDTTNQLLLLKDYQLRESLLKYSYLPADSLLFLQYNKDGKEYQVSGKALDWQKLPVLRKGFHWTAD